MNGKNPIVVAKAVKPIEKRIKADDLSIEHLAWLIQSRSKNQTACLNLFKLFESHPELVKNTEFRGDSQTLVTVGCSLWRAGFLADKTGDREAVFEDAKAFLARILTDNAVNYPQDRSSREWTFNYYAINANNGLSKLAGRWNEVDTVLESDPAKGIRAPHSRWNRYQKAFETAIKCLATELEERENDKTVGTRRRKSHR